MRRAPSAQPSVSLARLLERQAAAVKKHPDYQVLLARLASSRKLREVRLNRAAVRLLDQPRLKPRFLANFYRTYHLPQDPFFPLFLGLKWSIAARRESARADRARRIEKIMESCPSSILDLLSYLSALEGRLRPSLPIFKTRLYPRTLKRARELSSLDHREWTELIRNHVDVLSKSYRTLLVPRADELIARAILRCLPDPETGKGPQRAMVKSKFRELSKSCHPDKGGEADSFRLLSWARDELLG